MADNGITSPLLPSPSPDHLILTVRGSDSDSAPASGPQPRRHNHRHHRSNAASRFDSFNPFRFIGCEEELTVPPPTTVDPFRNDTPVIDGVYEWLKIAVCLPLALVRLVLFGLCLLVGYVATKLALAGWKDKENPVPRWRCRILWVTRISARCILFSFG